MMSNTEELVSIDLETTGVYPSKDRIVEVALVRFLPDGRVLDSYTSLVNPCRDVTASSCHGISASLVTNAPKFEEIAGDVLAFLQNVAAVGHNVPFDLSFIRSEFARLSAPLPSIPYYCTMKMSRYVDPDVPSRSLSGCCDYFGIKTAKSHVAYDDAMATMQLFILFMTKVVLVAPSVFNGDGVDWPYYTRSHRSLTRERAAVERTLERGYLATLVSKLPMAPMKDAKYDGYFALLDRVLEDRKITKDESKSLIDFAILFSWSSEQVNDAHRKYLEILIETALEDGVITESEKRDLLTVKECFGISDKLFEDLLKSASSQPHRPSSGETEGSFKGRSVCFTGECLCKIAGRAISREQAEQIASNSGLGKL